MPRPGEIIDGIVRSVEQSGTMPSDMTVLPKEASRGGLDGNVKLPVIQIQPVSKIDIRDFNTDRVRYLTDDSGNRIGKVFSSEYRIRLQLDVHVVDGNEPSARELGDRLYRVLYKHDSHGPEEPLPKEDGSDANISWRINIEDSEPAHELTTSPSLRRWRIDVVVWSAMVVDTTEEYITGFTIDEEVKQ